MLNEIDFETVYNVNYCNDDTFSITFKSDTILNADCNCTLKQFNDYVFEDLCKITTYDAFYDYCCEHECALI